MQRSYDWLRNTKDELQQLEEKLKEYAASQLAEKQLVVIGYSGNDESIMSFLENCVDDPSLLSKGLLWAIRKGSQVNSKVSKHLICDLGPVFLRANKKVLGTLPSKGKPDEKRKG